MAFDIENYELCSKIANKIIKNIKKEGYEIVKVSDIIYKDNYKIDVNGTQQKNK